MTEIQTVDIEETGIRYILGVNRAGMFVLQVRDIDADEVYATKLFNTLEAASEAFTTAVVDALAVA